MIEEGVAFVDEAGDPVRYWRDRRGRLWLKRSRWALRRVRCARDVVPTADPERAERYHW